MTFVVLRIIFFSDNSTGRQLVSKCSRLFSQLPRICRASVPPIMGNCLKSSGQDDISLLHDEESVDSPTTHEPPPPYQVQKPSHIVLFDCFGDYFKSLMAFFIAGGSANLYTKSTCSSSTIGRTADSFSSAFRPDSTSSRRKIRWIEREKERVRTYVKSTFVFK